MNETAVTITKQLAVPLDSYRKNALNSQMVEARMEELRITEHMKNVTDSLKTQIKEHQKKQTDCARAPNAGFEMMPVACEDTPDLDRNKMVTTRLDTMAVVSERALTVEEIKHYSAMKKTVKA